MDTEKAMQVLKELIDQATGMGCFKSADQVIIAVNAWNAIRRYVDAPKMPPSPAKINPDRIASSTT